MVQPLRKTVWQLLTKLNILLPYNPSVTLFGVSPQEIKSLRPHKAYTWMFIAALCIIDKTLMQLSCLSAGD